MLKEGRMMKKNILCIVRKKYSFESEKRIEQAWALCEKKLHPNKFSKDGRPFSSHIFQAAEMIIFSSYPDPEAVLSVLLIDGLEDRSISLREIEKLFGFDTAETVIHLQRALKMAATATPGPDLMLYMRKLKLPAVVAFLAKTCVDNSHRPEYLRNRQLLFYFSLLAKNLKILDFEMAFRALSGLDIDVDSILLNIAARIQRKVDLFEIERGENKADVISDGITICNNSHTDCEESADQSDEKDVSDDY